MNDIQIRAEVKLLSPRINSDLLDYAMSYFKDQTNDFTFDALTDFLFPLLHESVESLSQIHQFILNLSLSFTDTLKFDGPIALETPFNLTVPIQKDQTSKKETSAVDIAHTNRHVGKSIVDAKKLQKAEAKLALKRSERNNNDLYQSPIPVWNPDIVIPIMVNQAKPSGDNKSKDIRLENFDISFSGKVILKNANMSLAYGRRYGMVGMNGVGKSTLLRASIFYQN